MNKLYIIGFGTGSENYLTGIAKEKIIKANRVLSTSRISKYDDKIKDMTLSEIFIELNENIIDESVVLVSGDCGFFSISKYIVEKFSSKYNIELISGISSIQYLSSKIAKTYDDAKFVSMHGRNGNIVSKVAYNKKVFSLTGGEYRAHNVCEILDNAGLGNVKISIGEKLSYPDEKITSGFAKDLMKNIYDEMSVMYIENEDFINPFIPIKDSEFSRAKVPMTKEEVRWLSVQKLEVLPTDVVFDIGAGSGSVALELGRKAFESEVYAIEFKDDACDLINENIKKLKGFNVNLIKGMAPESMVDLPTPDKAFIGGSSGNMFEIIDFLVNKNSKIKIVINVIALQSLNELINTLEKLNFEYVDIACVNVSKSKRIGKYDMMMANNPIYVVTVSNSN